MQGPVSIVAAQSLCPRRANVVERDLVAYSNLTGDNNTCGRLWEGELGFSLQRWAFWKERFEIASSLHFVEDRTRAAADSAVKEMDRLDGSTESMTHPL